MFKTDPEEFKFAVFYMSASKPDYKMIKTEEDLEAEVTALGAKNIIAVLKACEDQIKELHVKTKVVIEE